MKKKAVIVFALVALAAIGFLLRFNTPPPNAPDPLFESKAASVWVELLIRQENGRARHAVQQLGPAAAPFLIRKLSQEDSFPQSLYVKVWPHLPSRLKTRWKRPVLNKDVRMRALEALRDMKPTPSVAVGSLMKRLSDKDNTIRLHAAIALGHIGPDAKPAVPLLKPFLKEKHVFRVYTAKALWSIEGNADEVLPVLEQGAQEEAPFRWSAVAFLGELGPAAEHAIPILEKITTATNKEAASCAVQSLAQINPRAAVPILIRTLNDPDPAMRISAAVALGKVAPFAKDAVPALIALLPDQTHARPVIMGYSSNGETVSNAAANSLRGIDPEAAAKAGVK